MQNNSKISEILREIMRFCAAHQPNDHGEALRISLKTLQTRKGTDHRTIVVVNAALKCFDEQSWLQIETEKVRVKLFYAASDTENCKDLAEREQLMLDTLVQTKLLAHISMASNRVGEGVKEYLLQALTYILAQDTDQQEDTGTSPIPDDSTIAPQLQALNEVVSSAREKLTANIFIGQQIFPANKTPEALTPATFEYLCASKSLAAVFAFAQQLLDRATSLSEVAVNTLPMFHNLSAEHTKAQKQWLLAYALAAATIADAADSLTEEALLSYGGGN